MNLLSQNNDNIQHIASEIVCTLQIGRPVYSLFADFEKNTTHPSDIYVENVNFDWFSR